MRSQKIRWKFQIFLGPAPREYENGTAPRGCLLLLAPRQLGGGNRAALGSGGNHGFCFVFARPFCQHEGLFVITSREGVATHDRPDGVPEVAELQVRVSRDREALLADAAALAESTPGLFWSIDDTRSHLGRWRCEPGIREGSLLSSHGRTRLV